VVISIPMLLQKKIQAVLELDRKTET